MKTEIIVIAASLLWLIPACDEKKKEITQELCEGQTNQADCESAGCTYTCGMVLTEFQTGETRSCLKRRNVGRCLAVVEFVRENDVNNQDYSYTITPDTIGWFGEEVARRNVNGTQLRYLEYFNVENKNVFVVEVLGHQSWAHDFGLIADPCSHDDPDGTLFPWEGSCETDWWSEDLWDDVLPE